MEFYGQIPSGLDVKAEIEPEGPDANINNGCYKIRFRDDEGRLRGTITGLSHRDLINLHDAIEIHRNHLRY